MAPAPWTSPALRICTAFAASALLAVLALVVAVDSRAASVATAAAKLARDTAALADVREQRSAVTEQLSDARLERRELRAQLERRLVAIYKHGAQRRSLIRVVGGESMVELARAVDVLDHVALQDAALVRRWRTIDARIARLDRTRDRLAAREARLERQVQQARERLSEAEARAARARQEAARMARQMDSPLLPKAGHPENMAMSGVEGAVQQAPSPIGYQQTGVASYYHDSFAGEETANGERYDPGAFTAAHPTLPFGTWVTVRGPRGSVAVRINDRGPFVGGRVIDLSRAAAAAIGLPGIGTVTLTVAA